MSQESRLSLIGQNRVFDVNGGQVAGFRNKIIGGDFSINPWQRGTSFAAVANGSYTADRWVYGNTSAAVHTISKDTSAPAVAQAGRFVTHSMLVDCTTADASVAAGDLVVVQQPIEGYNFLPLAQKPMVLSFWHAHTKTGVYCVSFRNAGSDRSFVSEYTQTVSDAWEYTRIIVFPSPSAGTWDYTTGIGLSVIFVLMCGTTFQTAANVWQTGNFLATSNQVNAADSTANNCRFALVQLENGATPTLFENRTVGTEISLCQRYFWKTFAIGVAPVQNLGSSAGALGYTVQISGIAAGFTVNVPHPVLMRGVPTITTFSPNAASNKWYNEQIAAESGTPSFPGGGSDRGITIRNPQVAGDLVNNSMDIHLTASAEL